MCGLCRKSGTLCWTSHAVRILSWSIEAFCSGTLFLLGCKIDVSYLNFYCKMKRNMICYKRKIAVWANFEYSKVQLFAFFVSRQGGYLLFTFGKVRTNLLYVVCVFSQQWSSLFQRISQRILLMVFTAQKKVSLQEFRAVLKTCLLVFYWTLVWLILLAFLEWIYFIFQFAFESELLQNACE